MSKPTNEFKAVSVIEYFLSSLLELGISMYLPDIPEKEYDPPGSPSGPSAKVTPTVLPGGTLYGLTGLARCLELRG